MKLIINKLFIFLLVPLCLSSMNKEFKDKLTVLKASSVMKPNRLKSLDLLHDEDGFKIMQNSSAYSVKNHQLDKLLLTVHKQKCLKEFLNNGYISVDQLSDGEFALKSHVRGLGGTGPITAGAVGFLVRVGCYTAYLLGAGTTVAAGTSIGGPGGAAAGTAAVGLALAQAGGAAGVIASTEALAMKATLGTLLLPLPLP